MTNGTPPPPGRGPGGTNLLLVLLVVVVLVLVIWLVMGRRGGDADVEVNAPTIEVPDAPDAPNVDVEVKESNPK